MNSSDYNNYLSAIKEANNARDAKELLAKIKSRLIAEYGLKDNDVVRLLGYFRYHV